MDEAAIVFQFVFVAGNQAAKIMQPGEEAFHEPAPPIAPQGPAILGFGLPAIALVGRDQLDAPEGQPCIQGITVISPVADEAGRHGGQEARL